jgi:hypothetical protein
VVISAGPDDRGRRRVRSLMTLIVYPVTTKIGAIENAAKDLGGGD